MAKNQEDTPVGCSLDDICPEWLSSIMRYALTHRAESEGPARQQLDAALNSLAIRGYRPGHALEAPPELLLNEALRRAAKNPSLVQACMLVWAELRAAFCGIMRSFLVERHPSWALPDAEAGPAIAHEWQREELEAELQAFGAIDAQADPSDVLASICILTTKGVSETPGKEPATGDEGESGTAEPAGLASAAANLAAWLMQHYGPEESLPPESPEWEESAIEERIMATRQALDKAWRAVAESLRQAASERRQQREQEHARQELAAALTRLRTEAGDALRFFGGAFGAEGVVVIHCPDFSYTLVPESLAAEGMAAAALQIDALRQELLTYQALRQRTAANVWQEQALQRERDEARDRVIARLQALSALVAPPQPPEETAPGGGSEGGPAPTASDVDGATPGTETAPEEDAGQTAQGGHKCVEDAPTQAEEPAESVERGAEAAVASSPTSESPAENESSVIEPPRDEGEEPPHVSGEIIVSQLDEGVCSVTDSDLLWEMIGAGDLAGAYWLARSLEAGGQQPPAAPWLLAAMQAAAWLQPGSGRFIDDLSAITRDQQPAADGEQWLLALAAALRPTVIAPQTGLAEWLYAPESIKALHAVVETLRDFARPGAGLREEDLTGAVSKGRLEDDVTTAARKMKDWLDDAPQRRMGYKRANDIKHELIDPKGGLRSLLDVAAQDQRQHVDRTDELLRWQDLGYIEQQIDRRSRGGGQTPTHISGPIRQDLIREIQCAVKLGMRWRQAVLTQREAAQQGDWRLKRAADLRSDLAALLPAARAELAELASPAQPLPRRSAAQAAEQAAAQLWALFDPPQASTEPAEARLLHSLSREAETLDVALAQRLLWLPELELQGDGAPGATPLADIGQAMVGAWREGRSLEGALQGWWRKQDYRFSARLIAALSQECEGSDLPSQEASNLAASRDALRRSADTTQTAVEQALVDGLINEEQRAHDNQMIEAIEAETSLSIAHDLLRLEEIRSRLEEARRVRLADQEAVWRVLAPRLPQLPLERAQAETLQAHLASAFERRDTRVVEETLAHLRDALDAGRPLPDYLLSPTQERSILGEFRDSAPHLTRWLSADPDNLRRAISAVRQGKELAGLSFGHLPRPRLEEASDAITAWRELKQQQPSNAEAGVKRIVEVAGFLGLQCADDAAGTAQVRAGKDWLHVCIRASVPEDHARPIPQFGSQANGHYDIVCLWERPSAEMISARLDELALTTHSPILFYLGRLKDSHREDLVEQARKKGGGWAVLDEVLLLFVAHETGARFPAFLGAALPYSALIPYTPFQAGNVPPEMFYGRDEMVRELQNPSGSCLVYGGRQLGKSALLSRVRRKFHSPARQHYAWLKDLKTIYAPQEGRGAESLWPALRDAFKELDLLPRRVATDRPSEIQKYLADAIKANRERRVLVLLDEADEFLDADCRDGFRQVIALRDLMMQTERRFKVVLAGLHNVQRFQYIPNQPLAHLGAPLCVGPLEPTAAMDLVREPFQMLGYEFADGDAAILRILSYTNYHPGLIQIFGQELLKKLHKTGASLPPYRVTLDHIQGVYSQVEVRELIRQRFDWTLALDERYQAIAWAMIDDQSRARDSYAQAYAINDVQDLMAQVWPDGFGEVRRVELDALLGEMCDMGVLVRTTERRYRLRSPNLVRLMGTENDVLGRLIDLSGRQPTLAPDANDYHPALGADAQGYSPLNYALERQLAGTQSGVRLVLASPMQGLASMEQTIRRLIPPAENAASLVSIPPAVGGGANLELFLGRELPRAPFRVVALWRAPESNIKAESLAEVVNAAQSLCQKQGERSSLQVVVALGPRATWAWLGLPAEERESIERRAVATLTPHPWNVVGVAQRLERSGRNSAPEVARRLLALTGGWHALLDRALAASTAFDPCPAAQAALDEMIADREQRTHALHEWGLEKVGPIAERVVQALADLSESVVPLALLGPSELGSPALSQAECDRAIAYLERMGCIQRLDGDVRLDPVVQRALQAHYA